MNSTQSLCASKVTIALSSGHHYKLKIMMMILLGIWQTECWNSKMSCYSNHDITHLIESFCSMNSTQSLCANEFSIALASGHHLKFKNMMMILFRFWQAECWNSKMSCYSNHDITHLTAHFAAWTQLNPFVPVRSRLHYHQDITTS